MKNPPASRINKIVFLVVVTLIGGTFLFQARPPVDSPETDAVKTAESNEETTESAEQSALTNVSVADANIPELCGNGGIALRDLVAVTGKHFVRTSADTNASKIKREEASLTLGENNFYQVDYSVTVRRLCAQKDWTEIEIVKPKWLTHVRGWVLNEALREIEHTAGGGRVYVEEDFYWDDDTSKFKPQIIAVVNKISRENSNCSTVETTSVAKSLSRSKADDPVFFVACGEGYDLFNVWFRPTDADSKQRFTARDPLEKSVAVEACAAAAAAAAIHPSTVRFSRLQAGYLPHISGRARVVSTFTAKNSFDLKLTHRISCLFDGPELIEAEFSENQG